MINLAKNRSLEKSFSEMFLIEVGSFTTLTLFLIVSRIYVVDIYSKLKGGSCLTKINLHFNYYMLHLITWVHK